MPLPPAGFSSLLGALHPAVSSHFTAPEQRTFDTSQLIPRRSIGHDLPSITQRRQLSLEELLSSSSHLSPFGTQLVSSNFLRPTPTHRQPPESIQESKADRRGNMPHSGHDDDSTIGADAGGAEQRGDGRTKTQT